MRALLVVMLYEYLGCFFVEDGMGWKLLGPRGVYRI